MSLRLFLLVHICFYHYSVCDYLYHPNEPSAPALPEIIINKNAGHSGFAGYVYPVPQQPFPLPPTSFLPPLQDDIPFVEPPLNGYLPPDNSIVPPHNDYLPPSINQPPPYVYGVPSGTPGTLPKSFTPSQSQVRVVSMACLDSSQSRFFRASVQSADFNSLPVLATSGCLVTQKSTDVYTISLEGTQVGDCGVRYCADKKMCLNLRVPTVPGLKLPEDRIVSLQCVPQSSTVSVVKSLGIKPQIIHPRTLGRSLGTIATGGAQRQFEPHIAIYRRGNNVHFGEFNQLVESGSTVLLGEDLLLKATVKESDGWKFSRMGTLILQQGIQGASGRKSVTLVDSSGCRVDNMKSICPEHPKQLTNLVTVLPFRAFLFQDGESDEMLLSVRLFGCMHYEDCQVQAKHCEEKASIVVNSNGIIRNAGRTKRTAHATATINATDAIANLIRADNGSNQKNGTNGNKIKQPSTTMRANHEVEDYESHLDFRVVMQPQHNDNNNNEKIEQNSIDNIEYYEHLVENVTNVKHIYNWYLITGALLLTGIIGLTILNIAINHKAINDKHTHKQVLDYFRKY